MRLALKVHDMSGPRPARRSHFAASGHWKRSCAGRSHSLSLRSAIELELYGDGAMFSYAVAVQDVWAFHWHNISGRSSVFLLSLLPAEIVVG